MHMRYSIPAGTTVYVQWLKQFIHRNPPGWTRHITKEALVFDEPLRTSDKHLFFCDRGFAIRVLSVNVDLLGNEAEEEPGEHWEVESERARIKQESIAKSRAIHPDWTGLYG